MILKNEDDWMALTNEHMQKNGKHKDYSRGWIEKEKLMQLLK